jgi:hypothetical protein
MLCIICFYSQLPRRTLIFHSNVYSLAKLSRVGPSSPPFWKWKSKIQSRRRASQAHFAIDTKLLYQIESTAWLWKFPLLRAYVPCCFRILPFSVQLSNGKLAAPTHLTLPPPQPYDINHFNRSWGLHHIVHGHDVMGPRKWRQYKDYDEMFLKCTSSLQH